MERKNYFYIAAVILAILLLIFFWKTFLVIGIISLIFWLIFRGLKQDREIKKRNKW